jgi:hypothetical protein
LTTFGCLSSQYGNDNNSNNLSMKTDLLIITIAVNDGSNFAGGRVDRLYVKPTSYVRRAYKIDKKGRKATR